MPMTMPNALCGGHLSAERSCLTLMTMPGTHDHGGHPWTLGGGEHLSAKRSRLTSMTMPNALGGRHLCAERSRPMPMTMAGTLGH